MTRSCQPLHARGPFAPPRALLRREGPRVWDERCERASDLCCWFSVSRAVERSRRPPRRPPPSTSVSGPAGCGAALSATLLPEAAATEPRPPRTPGSGGRRAEAAGPARAHRRACRGSYHGRRCARLIQPAGVSPRSATHSRSASRVEGNASAFHGISDGFRHSSTSFSAQAVNVPPVTRALYTTITGAAGYE